MVRMICGKNRFYC